MTKLKKVKIGDVLLNAGSITEQQIQQALAVQLERGGKLGDIFIQLGFISEVELLKSLSKQLSLDYIELERFDLKPDIVRLLPERISRRYRVIVLDHQGNDYLVGMADPTDVLAYDEVSRILPGNINLAVVKESLLLKSIDQIYRRTEDIVSFAEELQEEFGEGNVAEESIADDAPVTKLLDSIFEDAVQVNASDIHIEPDKNGLRIRQRVDGVLHEALVKGKSLINAIALKIKLIAKLDIAEKRLPQDGRFRVQVKNKEIDVRLSTMPVRYGESIVMRLLDQTKDLLDLDQIGMTKLQMERFKFFIKRPSGIILLTGPTGSGKTTTLYSALKELNTEEKNIITIEDPVEYTIPRINQVQVNPIIDLTFSRVLRNALRQDPDIIMIGEMRDEDTAQIGLRAAMTGHLILSTLHTNDAISSVMRLLDMGAEGYLLAGALRLIVAQRLLRRNCPSCSEIVEPNTEEVILVETLTGGSVDKNWVFKKGKGCSKCGNSGYSGRFAVHEFLEIDANLAEALRIEDSKAFLDLAIQQKNFQPLTVEAFVRAVAGDTTLEEVFKIASDIEDIRHKKSVNLEKTTIDTSKISL
jgi:MSHA biogenesis protein MshE